MEEIQSTDALEREILEDARRKAERALRAAEEESARLAAAGERRAAAAIADFERSSARNAERGRSEAFGALPLERSRILVSFVDSRLSEAVSAFLGALPEETVAAIVRRRLLAAAPYLGSVGLRLRYRGISPESARGLLAELGGQGASEAVEDPALASIGAVAEALDGSAAMRATLDIAAEALLGSRRGELAAALCGAAIALGAATAPRAATSANDPKVEP